MDVQAIESQLDELWKQKTEVSSGSEQQAVTRACVLNLVVCAVGEENVERVTTLAAELTTVHPSRVILILEDRDADGPALDASVSAQCHLAPGARKQICCEQIILKAAGERIDHVPSLVRPLLIPDLPVFLWWRGAPDLHNPLMSELSEAADRVIVDSSMLSNVERELAQLASTAEEERWTALSDLSWARLTPWRVSVAGFFDVPDYRDCLNRIDRVKIDCEPAGESICGPALLLAAWLASRLQWRRASAAQCNDEGVLHWDLKAGDRSLTIQFKISKTGQEHAGVHSIELSSAEPSARFAVSVGPNGTCLQGMVTLDGRKWPRTVFPLPPPDEAALVGRELEILGHDTVYERSLRFLSSH